MIQVIEPGTDERVIARSAMEQLREKLEGTISSLGCEFISGVLVLRGRTNSFYHKQLAQETVRQMLGVRVANRIEVVSRPH